MAAIPTPEAAACTIAFSPLFISPYNTMAWYANEPDQNQVGRRLLEGDCESLIWLGLTGEKGLWNTGGLYPRKVFRF